MADEVEEPHTALIVNSDTNRKHSKAYRFVALFRNAALGLVKWQWFERFSLLMITANCIALGMTDPCDDKCRKPICKTLQYVEHFIFAFFAAEMVLKMIALGLIGKNSYLADAWNRFDCFIVIIGAVEYAFSHQEINFSAIRAFRVLRPLRAITRISSLRILVTLLIDIMPMLGNVLIFCFFLFFVFGIVAVQLWAGLFRYRCFFPPTLEVPTFMPSFYQPPNGDFVCSTAFGVLKCNRILEFEKTVSMCNSLFSSNNTRLEICGEWVGNYSECRPDGPNPARGTLNFDNIGFAWIAIFQIISLEAWTPIMYTVQDAYSFWVWIYFIMLVMLGAYLAVNLCLVVIATQFSQTKAVEREKMRKERLNSRSNETPLSGSTAISAKEDLYSQIRLLILHVCRRALRKLCGKRYTRGCKNLEPETYLIRCTKCQIVTQIQAIEPPDISRRCQQCGFDSLIVQLSYQRRLGVSVSKSRALIRRILQHNVTTVSVMLAIVLNAIVMSLEHYGQPPELTTFIETMNLLFTIVFVTELVIKLYAYGPDEYFAEAFNALDTVIIIINVAELFSAEGGSGLAVLRLFRLFRIVKIIRFLPALQRQLQVMVATIDHVATFFFLLTFFLYIASLLGMSLFGCKFCDAVAETNPNSDPSKSDIGNCQFAVMELSPAVFNLTTEQNNDVIEPAEKSKRTDMTLYRCSVANFDSLFESLFTVLQIFTQDNWAVVMQDGMHYTNDWAGIYFVILVTIGNYIIFNLLIAILVEAFSSLSDDDDDILNIFGRSTVTSEDSTISQFPVISQKDMTFCQKFSNCLQYLQHADYTLFFFPRYTCPRPQLKYLLMSKYYDKVLLLVVIGSCVLIVLERPTIQPDSPERHAMTIAAYGFNIIFILEALSKIIAYGLIIGRKAYLRSWGNILDGALVLLAVCDIAEEMTPHESESLLHEPLRVLSLFRALRPLRVITRAPGLQVVIKTLMVSVKPIGHIVLICCFFFGIFSILGVQLFAGCFSRCVMPSRKFSTPEELANFTDHAYNESYINWANAAIDDVATRSDCDALGFQWYTERFNFDNLPNACLSLFVFATLDGWSAITSNGVACVGIDKQPVYGNNPWAYVYFISFLLIVCFFTLNMFVGVVVNNFQKVQKQVETRALRKLQELQATALFNRLGTRVKPLPKLSAKADIKQSFLIASTSGIIGNMGMRRRSMALPLTVTENETLFWLSYPKWRLVFYRVFTHRYFEFVVIAATFLNVLLMATEYYMMPPILHLIITTFGYIFLGFVIVEVVCKTIALGPKRYLSDRWNKLDAVITVISIICIIFDEIDYLPINPAIVRASRVFRIVRTFKLLKSASGLRHLMHTIAEAIPHCFHLSMLFVLLFFVYASLGVQMYGTFECSYDICQGLSRHANFNNFGMAMLTLFRIFTGDNWNEILKDVLWIANDPTRCNNQNQGHNAVPCSVIHLISPGYFISFVLLTQFVLINIVVAALLNQLNDPNNKHTTEADVDREVAEADAIERVEHVEETIAEQYPDQIESLIKADSSLARLDIDDVISIVSTEYILQDPIKTADHLVRPNVLSFLFNSAPTALSEECQRLTPDHKRHSSYYLNSQADIVDSQLLKQAVEVVAAESHNRLSVGDYVGMKRAQLKEHRRASSLHQRHSVGSNPGGKCNNTNSVPDSPTPQ